MLQETIAGKSVGKSDDSVIVFDRESGEYKTIHIKGRYLYVKKCKRAAEVNGILRPEKTQHNTNVCLVLAVGDGCGKWHPLTKEEEKLNDTVDELLSVVECTAGDVNVYDRILVPDEDPYGGQKGISRTTYAVDEYLVHECLAFAKIEE